MWIDLLVHDFDIIGWVTGDSVVEVTSVGSVAGLRRSDAGQDVRLEIVGSRGAFAAGYGPHTPLTSTDPGIAAPAGIWDTYQERFEPAFHAEMEHFVRMVRGGVESLTPPGAGIAATRIAEAAATSFRSGRPVRPG